DGHRDDEDGERPRVHDHEGAQRQPGSRAQDPRQPDRLRPGQGLSQSRSSAPSRGRALLPREGLSALSHSWIKAQSKAKGSTPPVAPPMALFMLVWDICRFKKPPNLWVAWIGWDALAS